MCRIRASKREISAKKKYSSALLECGFCVTLHPDGLRYHNRHALPPKQAPHDRSQAHLYDYRCPVCGNVLDMPTDTVWEGAPYDCATIVLVMRGFGPGISARQLADELELDNDTRLDRRSRV